MHTTEIMVKVQEIVDSRVWEKFVLACADANFLQSWNWGEFHRRLGYTIHRTGFFVGERLAGVMLSIVEKAKRASYVTIPGGPLIDWNNPKMVEAFVATIKKIARENGCSFVRVRPQIIENAEHAQLFSGFGFVSSPMHLHAELTHQLDITRNEEELLGGMRKATRYEIKQAGKEEIKLTTSLNPDDMEDFYDLQMVTAKRQGFVPFGRKYLREQFRTFAADHQTILYTAWLGDTKLAQAMVIFYGQEADYHYGASSEEGRRHPGAYLIQWEAIKEAKKRGLKKYNFWGVAPEGHTSHRFHGVSVFKRGFGGEDIAYLHARDLVISWPKYAINWLIETFRKVSRGL